MKKKVFVVLLVLGLVAGLVPGSALAASTFQGADSAVKVLDNIYGSGIFSADGEGMTRGAMKDVVSRTGWSTDITFDDNPDDPLTRSEACEVLTDAFALPVEENQSAIDYLYEKNIINGVAAGDLGENQTITRAQLAVVTYRILNAVGGGLGSEIEGLKPGTDAYYAWLYLAVRECVPFSLDDGNRKISEVKDFTTYGGSKIKENSETIYEVIPAAKSGEEIWEAWESALKDPHIGGDANFSTGVNYNPEETLLEAATRIVNAYLMFKYEGNRVIFQDVTAGDWFYDGIMYLADRQIVIGYGDGQFGEGDFAPRFQFATLLSVMDGTVDGTDESPDRILTSIQNVKENSYMNTAVPDEENWNPFEDETWAASTTRQEAVVGILRMIEKRYKIDTVSGNPAVLDRFRDCDEADDASKPYLAYAVSMGLLSGTDTDTLDLDEPVTRAQVGVLLYRTLIGLDVTKMQDYQENVGYALQAAVQEGGN